MHGVPHGSVLRSLLFSLYFAPVEDVILAHDLDCMIYADDIQQYVTINYLQDQSPVLANKIGVFRISLLGPLLMGLREITRKQRLFIYYPGLSSVILCLIYKWTGRPFPLLF